MVSALDFGWSVPALIRALARALPCVHGQENNVVVVVVVVQVKSEVNLLSIIKKIFRQRCGNLATNSSPSN